MGKTKQRMRKTFLGHQKKKGKSGKSIGNGCRPSPGDGEVDSQGPKPGVEVVHQYKPSDFSSILEDGNSASARKLVIFNDLSDTGDLSENGEDFYLFVQLSAVAKLLLSLLCPKCLQPGISVKVSDVRHGLAVDGMLSCKKCDNVNEEAPLCNKVQGPDVSQAFDINIKATLAFRGIGCGYSSMVQFLGLLNMPYSPSENLYRKNLFENRNSYYSGFSQYFRKNTSCCQISLSRYWGTS